VSWERAKDAAWRRWGAEHYRAIVGLSVLRRIAPALLTMLVLAVVGGGLWWVWAHAAPHIHAPHLSGPALPGWWPWAATGGGALLLALVVVAAYRHFLGVPHVGRRRWPAVAVVLAVLAGLVAWLVWG
jgi:hypothetical protein